MNLNTYNWFIISYPIYITVSIPRQTRAFLIVQPLNTRIAEKKFLHRRHWSYTNTSIMQKAAVIQRKVVDLKWRPRPTRHILATNIYTQLLTATLIPKTRNTHTYKHQRDTIKSAKNHKKEMRPIMPPTQQQTPHPTTTVLYGRWFQHGTRFRAPLERQIRFDVAQDTSLFPDDVRCSVSFGWEKISWKIFSIYSICGSLICCVIWCY